MGNAFTTILRQKPPTPTVVHQFGPILHTRKVLGQTLELKEDARQFGTRRAQAAADGNGR
jgi:hypothetical protein